MPVIIAGIIVAAAAVGTSAYSAHQESVQQKKLVHEQDVQQQKAMAFQEKQVKDAEAKAAGAEKLAGEEAEKKLKRQRAAQTNTILTSPLGISGEANTMKTTLGG